MCLRVSLVDQRVDRCMVLTVDQRSIRSIRSIRSYVRSFVDPSSRRVAFESGCQQCFAGVSNQGVNSVLREGSVLVESRPSYQLVSG